MENSEFDKHRPWIITVFNLRTKYDLETVIQLVCINGNPKDTPELREYVKDVRKELKLMEILESNSEKT